MSSYYYLISSLPALKEDGKLPIDYESFLDACRTSVSESTYQSLEELSVNSEKGPLVKEWADFYGRMKDELSYQRKIALGIQCEAPAERDPKAVERVAAAMTAENPLEAEKILLKFELDQLDSLMGIHYFDDWSLFGYALKLRLLERQKSFDPEEGREEFSRLFHTIQQQILSI